MPRPKIFEIARKLTKDIDPEREIDVRVLDGYVNMMVAAATDAFKQQPPGYSNLETGNLSQLYLGFRHTHRTIRDVIAKGADDPSSVDGLALARLQMEAFYSVCLMLEDSKYVSLFVKDSWRKSYVRFLLEREECSKLPRFTDYLQKQALPALEGMRLYVGVSEQEKATIEYEELGTALPASFVKSRIDRFPLPSQIIAKIADPECADMLRRLYPEYEYLCNFAHSSVEAGILKSFLDKRSPHRSTFERETKTNIAEQIYTKQVGEPAVIYSVLSVAQACAELTRLYPSAYELIAKTTTCWNHLANDTLLGQSLWETRTKKLLGAIS